MDNETKEMLKQVLANQAVIFQRLEDLYQKQIKGTTKVFYNDENALADLRERSNKIKHLIR